MPDQSSAASEHAIMQEITAPLATLPENPVSEAADVHFPVALRGYDRIAVDAYVRQTSQLVAELQATRSPEAAVRRALERVGEQISGILQRAHDTAEQITMQSRSDAEDRLEESRREAARITADAEQRLKDLDAETDRIWAERQQIVEDTRELARQLIGLTDSAADRFPAADETPGVRASGLLGMSEEGPSPVAAEPEDAAAEDELGVAEDEPEFAEQEPGFVEQEPGFAEQEPGFAEQEPGFAEQEPGAPQDEPEFAEEHRDYAEEEPAHAQAELDDDDPDDTEPTAVIDFKAERADSADDETRPLS